MPHEDVTLTDPGSPKPRHCRLQLAGSRLTRTSWTGGSKPRETVLDFDDDHAAERAFGQEKDKRLRGGFVLLRVPATAVPGDVVLETIAPNRSTSTAFDLHPDGGTLAVGTMLKEGYGAEIHLVDVGTGQRRLVQSEPAGDRQTFLHAVLFDADGTSLVFALNEQTWRLDLRTGEKRLLADYTRQSWSDRTLNPFCVRPAWDAARRRLLLFDSADRARVLDADGAELFELSTTARSTECRAGALSPSGRLLALYRPSRGIVYGHADAAHDQTNEIEVWDVDEQRLRTRIPVPPSLQFTVVGFDPTETLLVGNVNHAEGPCGVSIETGRLCWAFPDPTGRTDRWQTCFGWSYSPDGQLLAVGDRGHGALRLYRADTRDPAEVVPQGQDWQRVYRIVFSRDGGLMATGGDTGRLVVRRL
ncbi:hypothetical protein GCM10022225_61150 [Plantactinospora mayteni]|uniref:WD40 repeat domain-containing protein n=1 Tax=Plantactinospora mayteni TaxID=566021 RepID=A0ABQ4EZP7_9ACTN|nr:WD40 repeat domain-containing protein [Plantactinospora mayteni]GIH00143.1 hypothetical protein Pma05_67150 [Plantactinospora mayteni]